jgi:hypothetical protein
MRIPCTSLKIFQVRALNTLGNVTVPLNVQGAHVK